MWADQHHRPEQKKASPTISPRPRSASRPAAPAASWRRLLARTRGRATARCRWCDRTARGAPQEREPRRRRRSTRRLKEQCTSRPEVLPVPAASLRQAMQDLPSWPSSPHLLIDQTPEGLRIQLVDQEGRSMFRRRLRPAERARSRACSRRSRRGQPSSQPGDHHRPHQRLPQPEGRRRLEPLKRPRRRLTQILPGSGVDADRFFQVAGRAASEPLYPDDPRWQATAASPWCCSGRRPCCPPATPCDVTGLAGSAAMIPNSRFAARETQGPATPL